MLLLGGVSLVFAPVLLGWFLACGVIAARFVPRAAQAGREAAAARSGMVGQFADAYANILAVKLAGGLEEERVAARRAIGALLGPLDVTLRRGERLGIAGPSGAGKSTLVGLLLGFGRPEGGRILFAGGDVGPIPPAELRRRIALAPQHGRLFRRSLRDNLRHGCPEAEDADLAEAIALAGLGPVVAEHGLDADVGEDGALLSGGERQRVLLARALLRVIRRDAPLLLLDEATSALDAAAEAAVLDALLALPRAPAIVAVSHSEAVLRRMGQVVTLGAGGVG